MGYLIRFINNRDLAPENIMTAAVRTRLILDSPPGTISSLFKRLKAMDCPIPARSVIGLADELTRLRGRIPGEYALHLKPSRRNSRLCDQVTDGAPEFKAAVKLLQSLGYPRAYRPNADGAMHVMIAGMFISLRCATVVPTAGLIPNVGLSVFVFSLRRTDV